MSTNVKLTVADFDARIAQGDFDDAPPRVELLYGELCEMSPPGAPHDSVVRFLSRWSHNHVAEPVEIGVQTSLGIPKLDSVPLPDVTWIRPGSYGRKRPEPADVLLVIEVSDSSLNKDLLDKRNLYAAGGVKEYWVVDVTERQIHVFRKPSRGRYRDTQLVLATESIAPLVQPEAILDLGTMFRKALD